MDSFPNTYTLSKSIAEDLVNTYREKIPIAIARPSIVLSSYSEPYPGWIEGINGPTGLMLAIGKGVFRSLYCDPTSMVEAIPVDMAANALIALAWKVATLKNKELYICNISTAGNKLMFNWIKSRWIERCFDFRCEFAIMGRTVWWIFGPDPRISVQLLTLATRRHCHKQLLHLHSVGCLVSVYSRCSDRCFTHGLQKENLVSYLELQ